jgi:tetratricopeptide (TPR) repeat protein
MKVDPLLLPLPSEPYRGILPFRLLDWRIFFERDLESERLVNLVSLYRGVLLYGQSGTGKSSLLNAGLLPAMLQRGRAPERIRVFPEHGRELFVEPIPLQEENSDVAPENTSPRNLPSRFVSKSADDRVRLSCDEFIDTLHLASEELGPPLLIFDQFEELVTLFEENTKGETRVTDARAARTAIEEMLCRLLLGDSALPVKILFAFRDDYFARLLPLFSRIPGLMDQAVGLALPRVDAVEWIVRGPFIPSTGRGLPEGHFRNEQGQPDELSEPLAQKFVEGLQAARPSGLANLSEVQVLCSTLWRRPEFRDELLHTNDPAAVLKKILVVAAMGSLNDFTLLDRVRANVLLSNLVTEAGTRDVVSEENLISETRRNPLIWFLRGDFRKVLEQLLRDTHLVRQSKTGDNSYYELASEFLISWIQKQQRAFRRKALIVWSVIFAVLSVLVVALVILTALVYSKKKIADKARHDAIVAKEEAQKARLEADTLHKRSDSLVGLITIIEKDLTGALQNIGKGPLADEFKKRLAEYRRQYEDNLNTEGSWQSQVAEIRSRGDRLERNGDLSGALQLYLQGAERTQEQLQLWAEDPKAQMWLGRFYRDQGNVLSRQGNLQQAMERYTESRDINERLLAANGTDTELQQELVYSYNGVGDALTTQGNLTGALQSFRAGLTRIEELVKQDPKNLDRQLSLSAIYARIGNLLVAQQDLAGALENHRRSLDITIKLAADNPENDRLQRELSYSRVAIGDTLRAQGDLSKALENFNESLAICVKLVKQDPDNTMWQYDLEISHERVGSVLHDLGKLDEALKEYVQKRQIIEALTKRDPDNTFWQRDLAISYQKIGALYRDQHNDSGAVENLRNALVISEKLTKKDPRNTLWQYDVASCHSLIAFVLMNKDMAGALENHRMALAIVEKLARQDPANAEWQNELGYVYWQLGVAWGKSDPKAKKSARAMIQKARNVFQDLKKRAPLTPAQQGWLDGIEADLSEGPPGG